MTATSPAPAGDELDVLLEAALTRAGEPLGPAAARKALPVGRKPPTAEVGARLARLVERGRLHRWPGRSMKFSSSAPQALARAHVSRLLASGPLTEAEIKRGVPSAVRSLVRSVLAALTGEGVVRRHPKLGRRQPFGLGPPDARDYLAVEIDATIRRVVGLGFPEPEVRAALRRLVGEAPAVAVAADGDGEAIVAAMSRLNTQAGRGALVYIAALRAAVGQRFRDKDSFDRAVLALAEQGRVQLQSHAWPGRLSESEKSALIPNGRGSYFDAIGLRLE